MQGLKGDIFLSNPPSSHSAMKNLHTWTHLVHDWAHEYRDGGGGAEQTLLGVGFANPISH